MKKFFVFLIALFSFGISVHAASSCTYQEQTELNQKASNIKPSYEISYKPVNDPEYPETDDVFDAFNLTFLNIPEELYLIITNDINDERVSLSSTDVKDGVATYRWTDDYEITNFTIEVYTSDKTGCPNEKYKTLYLTTPRYNKYYEWSICVDNPDFYLCQKYVTVPEFTDDLLLDRLDSYRNEQIDENGQNITDKKTTSLTDKIFDFIDKYKFIVIGGAIVIVGGVVTIKVLKNRNKSKKSRDLGL